MNLIDKEIEKKLAFIKLAELLGDVKKAAKIVGYHYTTYYRLKKIYEIGGEEGLRRRGKRKPKLPKEVEEEVLKISYHAPKWGSLKIYEEMKSRGVKVSERAIYEILKRNKLNLRHQRLERSKNKGES